MLTRRSVLRGLGGGALLAAADAHAIPVASDTGMSASPALLAAVRALASVREGQGSGSVYIVYAPWCRVSPDIYRMTRAYLPSLRLNWIPFSGGQPEGKQGTEYLLRSGDPKAIPDSFVKLRPYAVIPATPLSDTQDAAVNAMLKIFYRDIGYGLLTPTLFYAFDTDRVRVIRGLPSPEGLAKVAASAS